jgi:hypothetical protein
MVRARKVQMFDWAWNYDNKGIFSVRSAYRMIIYLSNLI